MVHKKEEGTYHHMETLMKEMPGFLSPGRGLPLLLIPEYSGIYKEQSLPSLVFLYGDKYPLSSVNHTVKVIVYNSLSL